MAGSRSDRRGKRAAPPPPVIDLTAEELREPAADPETQPLGPDAAEPEAVNANPEPAAAEEAWPRPEAVADDSPPIPPAEDPPAAEAPPPPLPPAPESRPQGRGLAIAGACLAVLIAAAVGAWLYQAYGSRFFPDSRIEMLETRLDQAAAEASVLADRVAGIDTGQTSLRQSLAQEHDGIEALRKAHAEATAAARQSIEAGDSRIADLERKLALSQAEIEKLRAAMAEAGEAGGAANALLTNELKTSVEQLTARLTEAEGRLAAATGEIEALRKAAAEADETEKAADSAGALGRAVSALSGRLSQGAPYAAELDALLALAPGTPGLDVLRAHAGQGVATAPALAERLAGLLPDLAKAAEPIATAPAETGLWASLRARLASLVRIRRSDEPDWPALATRALADVEAGRVSAAIEVLEQAKAPPPALADWLAAAKARRDADAALERLEAAALRQLGGNP